MEDRIELAEGPPALTFTNGLALHATAKPGTIVDGTAKDGAPREVAYDAGAAVLVDSDGRLVAGPIDFDGAELLCRSIINGDARAATGPGVALRLAIAHLAFVAGAKALAGGSNVEG